MLLEQGNEVIAFDNLFARSKSNLKSFSKNKNFKFIKGDVQNKTVLKK